MIRLLRQWILSAAVLGLLLVGRAEAELIWIFSYEVSDGVNTTSAMGTMTTTDTLVGGYYTVIAISGNWTLNIGVAETITSLIAPGGYDVNENLLAPTTPYLTFFGVSFNAVDPH